MNSSLAQIDQEWAEGYPNASSPAVIFEEGKWKNVPTSTPVTAAVCARNSGYTFNNETGKYYRFRNQSMNYGEAELRCILEGGNLAITFGPTYPAQLMHSLYNTYGPFWIAGVNHWNWNNTWTFPNGK